MTSQEFTRQEYERITKLLMLCELQGFFVYDHMLIRGDPVILIKSFIKEKPSGTTEFRVWLIDCGLVVKELSRKDES